MLNWLAQLSLKSVLTAASISVAAAGSVLLLQNQYPDALDSVGLFSPPQPKPAEPRITPVEETPSVSEQVVSLPAKSETEPTNENTAPVKPVVPAVQLPKFDIMRVEQDGSMLVAGSAKPRSVVELVLQDGTVLGSGKSGLEGDFVILPNDPLPPGDYVITLRAKSKSGEVVHSGQTGIVKVPEAGEELLAMISEEGKASQIVAKPKALEADTAKNVPDEPQVKIARAPVEQPKSVAKVIERETKIVLESVAKTEAPVQNEEVVVLEQPTPGQEPTVEGQTALASIEPEISKTSSIPKAIEAVESPKKQVKQPKTRAIPQVVVEAVEVEGEQVFIAGGVPRGTTVRIYIDNKPVGSARGTADDRFLIAKNYNLTAGQHSVRADVIDRGTGNVLSRAEVPLLHEPPAAAKPEIEVALVDMPTKPKETKVASVKQIEVPSSTTDVGTSKVTTAEVPKKSEAVQARKSVVEKKPKIDVAVNVVEPSTAKELSKTVDVVDSASLPVNPIEPDSGPIEETSDSEVVVNLKTPQQEPENTSSEATETKKFPVEIVILKAEKGDISPVDETIATVTPKVSTPQPALPVPIKTGSAVIIKPGDNLWRISRKTYGRGIRYTTIYNANRDQIRDPNRIYIGQIFKIPEKAVQ